MAAPIANVLVGSETGLLKGISVAKGTWRNLNHVETPSKANEITCMCWDDESESSVTVGLRSHQIAHFNVLDQQLSSFSVLDQGSDGNLKSVSKLEDVLITAYDNGLLYIQTDESNIQEIATGSHLQCMSRYKNLIGTGGKEADLKLFDINNLGSGTPLFQAKNVRNDWLNLRVPVWVTCINFFAENKIVTSTGHHQVRVYDPSVQRRPVLDMTFDEYPITAMSSCSDYQVIVGNTQGNMGLLDIRKGALVHRFKGIAGGIRSIQCHSTLPVVASCGLDRFFRIHDVNTKEMLQKMYMKSRLNCLLMSKRDWTDDSGENDESVAENSELIDNDHGDSDENDDEVWERMKVVKTRTIKRKGIVEDDDNINMQKSSKKKARSGKKQKKT